MNKIVFWSLFFAVLFSFIYSISETLAPFIIAFIFAYLLHPIIDIGSKKLHLPRYIVSIFIFILFVSSFVFGTILLLPLIYKQISSFISKIPSYKNNFQHGVTDFVTKLDNIDTDIVDKITDSIQIFINSGFSIVASVANNFWGYTLATINFFAIIALVPVILYYFLRDWPKIIQNFDSILPISGRSKISEIFSDINILLSAYIRGQLNICVLLSIYYILGFNLIGLDLALLLGIISGFFVIIPFIGTFISLSLALISCYFAFGASIEIIYILGLFLIGYIAEGYFLTPKIIGDRIGLHPVWIIFAVFSIGTLFGFVGIIFAIPIAGIVKLLLSHMIKYYKSTKFYKN